MPVLLFMNKGETEHSGGILIHEWQVSLFLSSIRKDKFGDKDDDEVISINLQDYGLPFTCDQGEAIVNTLNSLSRIQHIRKHFDDPCTIEEFESRINEIIRISQEIHLIYSKPEIAWLCPDPVIVQYAMTVVKIMKLIGKDSYVKYCCRPPSVEVDSEYTMTEENYHFELCDIFHNPKYVKDHSLFTIVHWCDFQSQIKHNYINHIVSTFKEFVDYYAKGKQKVHTMRRILNQAGDNSVRWFWNAFHCERFVGYTEPRLDIETRRRGIRSPRSRSHSPKSDTEEPPNEIKEFYSDLITVGHTELAEWIQSVERIH